MMTSTTTTAIWTQKQQYNNHRAIIAATLPNKGIGIEQKLAHIKNEQDVSFFKDTLKDYNNIFMGHNTYKSMIHEYNIKFHLGAAYQSKSIFVITRKDFKELSLLYDDLKKVSRSWWSWIGYTKTKLYTRKGTRFHNTTFMSIDDLYMLPDNSIVIGGEQIYKHFINQVEDIFLSVFYDSAAKNNHKDCTTFFPPIPIYFSLKSQTNRDNFSILHYSLTEQFNQPSWPVVSSDDSSTANCLKILPYELCYRWLCQRILMRNERLNRTEVAARSKFSEILDIDISSSFPLLTSKHVSFYNVFHELMWFIRGNCNVKQLMEHNVHIWDANTSRQTLDTLGFEHYKEHYLKYGYPYLWRNYGGRDDDNSSNATTSGLGADQIEYVLNLLKTAPYSRRIILCNWIPHRVKEQVLPPCHVLAQWYVDDNDSSLSCQIYMRSADVFLGLPYNVASYALLTYILAMKADLKPNMLHMILGDTHIYTNHEEAVYRMLKNECYALPVLHIDSCIKDKDIKDIQYSNVKLLNYSYVEKIIAPMAI